ncbi:TOMM precursor leader peptide-binding protein [Streptantibioticus ferralitis]|uniref:TOMM leader peptide-binding protein n=1 Tax=Streptantibioticus ferralitis TaxID=236510 RepID=A0ABT5YTH3_9ACTN|nr:TOMM precursor leader peptide-binding protein [Streptantibioticus ferralitis]MDF2254626.1 TOMM precursor leader peptide-binding protein [Streptantibioticus ferralitis]
MRTVQAGHPMLKPALRRSWRGPETLQFGVDPAHAVVLGPLDDPSARFLGLLDGTRGPALLREEAAALGLAPDRADRLLGVLADGGVLDDADSAGPLDAVIRHQGGALERLRPDLASLSVVHPEPGAAAARLAARRAARVKVCGAGRIGASVAAVLSAAGVGRVAVADGGQVEPWDAAPCGIPAAAVGERREAAARGAVRRAAPDPRPAVRPARPEAALGLAVIAPRDGLSAYAPDPRPAEPLMAARIPHLYAGVVEGLGVVGPLVLPGRSACAECLERARAEADPAWPRILAQLRSGRPPGVQACDIALSTLVAGLAATHALALLDGRVPPSAGARVEFSLAGLGMRMVDVAPHAQCGCGAVDAPGARDNDRVTTPRRSRAARGYERGAHVGSSA